MTVLPTSILPLLQISAGGSTLVPFMLQVVAIFAIFYFLLIRPQSTQRRRHEESLRNLKRGDRVVTSGGIIGEVVHIREVGNPAAASKGKGLEDEITIKSAESRLVIERGRIARISGVSAAPSSSNT